MTHDDPNVIQPGRDPTTFTGAAISPGVGMGPAWLVVDLLKSAPDPVAIARDQIAGEWSRFLTSFEQDPPRARGLRPSHRGTVRRHARRHLPRARDDARRHPLIR